MDQKAYIFLAEGFEEVEALTPVDLLRRADVAVELVAVGDDLPVTGAHGITVRADLRLADADFADGSVFILPGGQPGTRNLCGNETLRGLIIRKCGEGCRIAAICAAPGVLGTWGLLQGKRAVCYPGVESQLEGASLEMLPVVTDGNITTSRGVGTAADFGLELVRLTAGAEKAEAISHGILHEK